MTTHIAPTSSLSWTLDDIAAYYRRSVRQTRRIVSSPGFPPPLRGDAKRWSAERVRAWAEGDVDDGTTLTGTGAAATRVVRRKAAA